MSLANDTTSSSEGKSSPALSYEKCTASEPRYHIPDTPLFRMLPATFVPYAELMRLDRPAGWYAFYWHYAIGLSFSACVASPVISPTMLVVLAGYLAMWVLVLRGAVCTWNDNLDQEFDRQVSRTRFRPIARGAVSTTNGHLFTAAQMVLGAIMLLPLPGAASIYAAFMTLVLIIYPLGKRFTDFPQVILGFGFAIPVYMCSAAAGLDLLGVGSIINAKNTAIAREGAVQGAACLYLACALWTIIFDTIYAHQDIKDDAKAGVKGLALLLGDQTKFVCGILAVAQTSLLAATGILCNLSWVYFAISCGGVALALCAMLVLVDLKDSTSCAWWFGPGSRLVGTGMVLGLIGHYTSQNAVLGLL